MAQVLLFNLRGEKLQRIRPLLIRLGLAGRIVPPEAFGRPLGALLGRPGFDGPEEPGEPFSDEMLVLDGLSEAQFQGLLEGLRRARAAVALKAVVTGHNAAWTAARLHGELTAEHAAMTRGRSIHGENA